MKLKVLFYAISCLLFLILLILGLFMITINHEEESNYDYFGEVVTEIYNKVYYENDNVYYVNTTLGILYTIYDIETEGVYLYIGNQPNYTGYQNYTGNYVWIITESYNPYQIAYIYPVSNKYLLFDKLGPILIVISIILLVTIIIVTIKLISNRRNNFYFNKKSKNDYKELN